jgi:hypothetical protein
VNKNLKLILSILSTIVAVAAAVVLVITFLEDIKAFVEGLVERALAKRPAECGDAYNDFSDLDEFADFADV